MKKITLLAAMLTAALSVMAQSEPRLFLDIPSIYLTAPDVQKIGNRLGAGADAAFNIGTHWSVARVSAGAIFSLDPKSGDVGKSFLTSPFTALEVGLGKYRSNGNRCAKSFQSAFTAMAKGGLRYDFQAKQLDYTVGAEFGYFFIRDMFKNTEIVASANYLTQAKTISANLGFKLFLNLRARRD
jgi:hypothetical protein